MGAVDEALGELGAAAGSLDFDLIETIEAEEEDEDDDEDDFLFMFFSSRCSLLSDEDRVTSSSYDPRLTSLSSLLV